VGGVGGSGLSTNWYLQKSAKGGAVAATPASASETDDLFLKKAWEIALAPAKAIPMNAIMMYMSGNSLQIFSIMMTVMLFMNPIKALSAVGSTFSRYDNERTHARLWPVKLAFIALQLATIALGIWKVNGMGLLPYGLRVPHIHSTALIKLQDYALRLARVGKRTTAFGVFGTHFPGGLPSMRPVRLSGFTLRNMGIMSFLFVSF
jgi:hypothetical protein